MSRPFERARALAGILALPFLFVGFDLALDKGTSFLAWNGGHWKIWLTGFAWDVSAWLSFLWVASRLVEHPRVALRRIGWLLVGIDSLALSAAGLVSAAYRAEYHHLPNVQALYFAVNEWRNTLTLATEYVDPRAIATMVLSVPFVFALHRFALWGRLRLRPVSGSWTTRAAGILPILVALGISPLALGWHRFQEPLPLLANWSRIFFQAALGAFGNKTNLQTPARLELPAGQPTWNVVLLLDESLRADAFVAGLGLLDSLEPQALAPFMSSWLARPEVVVFPKARSNSTATSVSVPSLVTGVAANGTTFQFHRSPTVFTAAKAAGLRTFLLTSQDWNWEHFDQFTFGGIDHVVHRSSFAAERNNDLGVDDSLILDSLDAMLAPKGRFFGIIQLNSNHGPFWPGPGNTHLANSSRERYLASVRYVDRIHQRIFQRLERDPRWDSTFVILVADHGENLGARKIGRINSFFEETVRVPFAVRVPAAFSDSSRSKALEAWKTRSVQLLDVMPTLLDLWRIPLQPVSGLISGADLFTAPSGERLLGGQNTGDIRSWDMEGLYLVHGDWKFVLTQGKAPGLFDLAHDPREESSLWDSLPIRRQHLEWIVAAMRDPLRQGVCRRAGEWCPVELRSR